MRALEQASIVISNLSIVVCAFADLMYALKSEVIKSMRCSIQMYSKLKSPCQFSWAIMGSLNLILSSEVVESTS